MSYAASWHLWWELNREYLLGLRQTLRSKDVTSGTARPGVDSLAEARPKVRAALREVASSATHNDLRAAALCALGRIGTDEEAAMFLRLLRAGKQPAPVLEAAAIGLGLIPRIEDKELRLEVRGFFDDLLAGSGPLSGHTRQVAIMATSMRARDDHALAWTLILRCDRNVRSAREAAALLFGCALSGEATVLPDLIEAVRTGTLGGRRLHDAARSHAVLGLAMTRHPGAIPAIVPILKSRGSHIHSRRSAALALGLLLRRELTPQQRGAAEKALMRTFDRSRDPLVKGFCAVGMGTAREPFGIKELVQTVERRARSVPAPFAALALGLAVPRLEDGEAQKVRDFLGRRLAKEKDIQLAGALSIAVGMARSKDGKEALLEMLADKHLNASVRGPAIQGLGLLRQPHPAIERTLVAALDEGADEVVEDSALALGFLGKRSTARLLVDKLVATRSESVQKHMVAALSHLGGTAAIEPLLKVLANTSHKHTVREAAASALGILAAEHDRDPLFEIDAHTNPYALTEASRKLVLVY